MPTEPQSPYRLVYTGLVQDALRALAQEAKRRAQESEYRACLHLIEKRLRADPSSYGEPRFILRHIDLQVRAVATEYIYVRFAVDTTRRIVYVLQCTSSARLTD